ncbi:CDP-alcohol phosphatidyltransferase family protein, partial [Streptomyces lydicus]
MTTESGSTEPEERAASDGVLGGIFADRILTVPNVLSVLRLLGVPLLLWLMLVQRADGWAFALLIASGVTDFLDGKLARLLDQSSRLGALLDPFVDRLYLVTTLAAFVIRGLLPVWVAVLLIGREAVLAQAGQRPPTGPADAPAGTPRQELAAPSGAPQGDPAHPPVTDRAAEFLIQQGMSTADA